MLTLTTRAVLAIREITVESGRHAGTGLRIATSPAAGNGVPGLEIAIAEQPEPSDQIVETGGARVFLDPGASATLDDKRLDATEREGQTRFLIAANGD